MTTKERVMQFLSEEGYCPKLDDDGDVVFKAEGRTFLYYANEGDQAFFQLAMPFIEEVTEENRELALEACNTVCSGMKVAKAAIIGSNVWVMFENLLDSTPDVSDIMPRAIGILRAAQQKFYEAMQ